MANLKFEVGEVYRIKFWDHCTGAQEPMKCEVVGFVLKSNPLFVSVSHWVTITDCAETREANLEPTTILKSCIVQKRKL